jgi:hypothetical protein
LAGQKKARKLRGRDAIPIKQHIETMIVNRKNEKFQEGRK